MLNTLLVLLLFSCSTPDAQQDCAPIVEVADFPQSELTSFAISIDSSVSAGEGKLFNEAYDKNTYLNQLLEGLVLSNDDISNLAGLIGENFNIGDQLALSLGEGGSYTLLDIKPNADGTEAEALYRMVSPSGLNYHKLLLKQEGGQNWITNIYVYYTGQWLPQLFKLNQIMSFQMQEIPVSGLSAAEQAYVDYRDTLKMINEAAAAGNMVAALETHRRLPQELQTSTPVLLNQIMLAANVSDDALQSAIADYNRSKQADPFTLALHLNGAYQKQGEYNKALQTVDVLEKGLPVSDPYLDVMRSQILHEAGRTEEATEAARKAYCATAGIQQPAMQLALTHIYSGQYNEALVLLERIKERYQVDIDAWLSQVEEASSFRQSKEYQKWNSKR